MPPLNPHPHYAEASDGHVLEERLFFPKQSPEDAALQIVFAGYERCAPDFEIKREGYLFYVLEYPLRGHCDLLINGQLQKLSVGSISGFTPQCSHHYRALASDPMEHYFIAFTGHAAERLFKQTRLFRQGCIQIQDQPEIEILIRTLIEKGLNNNPRSATICNQYLHLLLLELGGELAETQSQPGTQSTFLDCKHFIELHFSWLASAQEIATHCQMSTRHLSRLFQQHGNLSPQAYLMHLKMHKASVLLRASQASIQSIAHTVGFEDPYHFSRNFKKAYRVSPKTYRNSQNIETAITDSLS